MITNLIAFALTDRVLLSWPNVKGVSVYSVFRNNEFLAGSMSNTFVDVNPPEGRRMTYHVVPGLVEQITLDRSEATELDNSLLAPTQVNSSWVGRSLVISWQEVEGADGYIVYSNGNYAGMTKKALTCTLNPPMVGNASNVGVVAFSTSRGPNDNNKYSPMSVIARPRKRNLND